MPAPAGVSEGFLPRLRAAGAPRSLAPGPDPALGRSKGGNAHRGRGPGLAAAPGFQGVAPGTKDCPTCAGGAGTSPRAAPTRTREVTSGAGQPEKGPARAGGAGRSTPRHAPRPWALGGGGGGASRARTASRFRWPGRSFIFMRRVRGGTRVPRRARPPGRESSPGGDSGPSGAPPASASGREFPLGHDSKMCRSRSSAPSSLPWARGRGKSAEGLSQGSREDRRGGSSFPGQVRGDSGLTAPSFAPSKIAPVIILSFKT